MKRRIKDSRTRILAYEHGLLFSVTIETMLRFRRMGFGIKPANLHQYKRYMRLYGNTK